MSYSFIQDGAITSCKISEKFFFRLMQIFSKKHKRNFQTLQCTKKMKHFACCSLIFSRCQLLSTCYPFAHYFSPTRWTVRVESLRTVLDNSSAINILRDNSLQEKLDPAMRGRIIRVQR